MQSAGFPVRLAVHSSLATHASEPRVSLVELTRLAPIQVTHAGIAEVGDEAFKPLDWRGCMKAGNYLRLPLCFLLGIANWPCIGGHACVRIPQPHKARLVD
jgi:hypothetical protein